MLADFDFGLVRLGEQCLFERNVLLAEHVDFRHVNHRVAECTRNIFVDDGDYRVGALDCRNGRVGGSTERNVAVLVRSGYLHHRHVARKHARTVETLGLAEEYRNVVGVAALGYLADVAAHEERVELEDALELRVGIRRDALGVEVVDMHILELVVACALAHSLDKAFRCGRNGTEMHVVARLDNFDSLFRRRELDLISHNLN